MTLYLGAISARTTEDMARIVIVIGFLCFAGVQGSQSTGRVHMKDHYGSRGDSFENVAHQWLGKWESVDGSEENFDQLLDAVREALPYYSNSKIIHDFSKKGDDEYVHKVKIGSGDDQYQLTFKLDQEGTLRKPGAPEMKFTYEEVSGNKLVVQQSVPSKNVMLEESYKVQGDRIIKEYSTGDIRAKRTFRRMNHL